MASRRFIAGAVCPACQALDRILVETFVAETVVETSAETVVETGAEQSRRRCVSCGFVEIQRDDARDLALGVPRGKPEQRTGGNVATQIVKIVDPSGKVGRSDE